MVQRRAARYITGRYHKTSSVTDMIGDLKLETLEERRTKTYLLMMYNIINGHVDIYPHGYLTITESRTPPSHDMRVRLFLASTNNHKYSFFPSCISLWNNLASLCINRILMVLEKKPHQLNFKKFSISCEQIHMNLRAVLVRVLWPMAITVARKAKGNGFLILPFISLLTVLFHLMFY